MKIFGLPLGDSGLYCIATNIFTPFCEPKIIPLVNGFYCSECFADRIVGYDAENRYPIVDVTEEQWAYLHNSK
jgi:hypothetical protein